MAAFERARIEVNCQQGSHISCEQGGLSLWNGGS
jgi:hypothetical protein